MKSFFLSFEANETANHLISEYSKLAQKKCKTRHDWNEKVINFIICDWIKCDKYYKPESFIEN